MTAVVDPLQPKRRTRAPRDLPRGEATRRHIKLAALRLFATRGIDAVSIREIVKAAGQKNAGSVNYYFRSKDELIRELIFNVARLRDEDHERKLVRLEEHGGPTSIREIVAILVESPKPGPGGDDHSLRFLNMVMINHRDLMFQALQGGADRGMRRCLGHLRRLLPKLPPPLVQQRLMLVVLYLFAVASSREAAREHPENWRNLWGHPAGNDNLIDSVEGLLRQPPSAETLAALGGSPAPGVRTPMPIPAKGGAGQPRRRASMGAKRG